MRGGKDTEEIWREKIRTRYGGKRYGQEPPARPHRRKKTTSTTTHDDVPSQVEGVHRQNDKGSGMQLLQPLSREKEINIFVISYNNLRLTVGGWRLTVSAAGVPSLDCVICPIESAPKQRKDDVLFSMQPAIGIFDPASISDDCSVPSCERCHYCFLCLCHARVNFE